MIPNSSNATYVRRLVFLRGILGENPFSELLFFGQASFYLWEGTEFLRFWLDGAFEGVAVLIYKRNHADGGLRLHRNPCLALEERERQEKEYFIELKKEKNWGLQL